METIELDKRIHAYRSDIANIDLKEEVKAENYVAGEKYQTALGITPLYKVPDHSTALASQLLYGEYFNVFEIKNEWAWGQSIKDDYVGYCPISNLTPDLHSITHHVLI